MAEMLLLNPRKRRARKSNPSKRRHRRRNPSLLSPRRVARRVARRTARRSNPMPGRRLVIRRRRRNPIAMGGMARGAVAMLNEALIGGAGAIAVDAVMGQVGPMLPASLQRVPGSVGAGDAVKALITIVLGRVLSRPTRGLSMKAAQGALTVQAHGVLSTMVPSSLALGYATPGQVMPGSPRIGPNARMLRPVGRYVSSPPPLLNRYVGPANSPLLSGSREQTMAREGVMIR